MFHRNPAPNQPFIRLSHATGTWEILQPAPAPADDRKIEQLLDTLYGTTIDQFVWPTPTHLGDLDELTSTLKTNRAIWLRIRQPRSDFRKILSNLRLSKSKLALADHAHDYVLLNGAAEVGTVLHARHRIHRTPEYLRDDRLFFLRPSAISRFEIACGDTTPVLTQTQNTWSVRSPISGPADSRAVAAVLDQLPRLRAHALFASPGKEAQAKARNPPSAALISSPLPAHAVSRWHRPARIPRLTVFNSATTSPLIRSPQPICPRRFSRHPVFFKLCDKSILSVSSGTIRRISRIDKTGEIILARTTPDTPWRPQNEQLQALRLREPALKTFATLGDLRAEGLSN